MQSETTFELRPHLEPWPPNRNLMADPGGNPTLPSLRELELEQLLREREQQISDLTVECTLSSPSAPVFSHAT